MDQDGGNIVFAPILVGLVNQHRCFDLGNHLVRKDFRQLLFCHHRREAVGAEQKDVAGLYVAADHIDFQLLTTADHPEDKVFQGMVVNLFLADYAEIGLFLYK